MKLLTKAIIATLPKLYETEEIKLDDKIVRAKFFSTVSNWTWYVIEYDGNDICWGLVDGFEKEFGYFSIRELEAVEVYGVGIERDLHFTPTELRNLR